MRFYIHECLMKTAIGRRVELLSCAPMLLLLGSLALVVGCTGDDDTPTPSPTATAVPPVGTPNPSIEATIEDESWGGTLHWQDFSGAPDEENVRVDMAVELHIYEYNYSEGYWCGRMEREIVTAEQYKCPAFQSCFWKDRMDNIDEPIAESVVWGVADIDPSDSDLYRLCLWGGPVDERGAPSSPPTDPDEGPNRFTLDCSSDPEISGHWDSTDTTPSHTLYGFDMVSFQVDPDDSGSLVIDFPATNLSSIASDGYNQANWCGDWITGM